MDEAQLPGFNTGMRLARVGGGALLDLREPARDGSGVSVAIDGTYAHGLAADPSRHGVLSGETVVALGGNDRLLLLRARAAMVERFGSAPVPFEELVMPSGRAGMRGFPEGRFRVTAAWSAPRSTAGTSCPTWTRRCSSTSERWRALASRTWTGIAGSRASEPACVTTGDAERYWEAPVLDGVQLAYAPDGGFRVLLALAAF